LHKRQANVILRGLRAISDFEYELQLASTNRQLRPEAETFFLMTSNQHSFISSGMVKEVAKHGADVKELVPSHVAMALAKKFDRE
jgi:pantetheine-phosphate adenylyltransferase